MVTCRSVSLPHLTARNRPQRDRHCLTTQQTTNRSSPSGFSWSMITNRFGNSCVPPSKRPEWQIVGEASDGIEAVHKAKELQPDLILLDLGLPSLNGIEAAQRIRNLAHDSKILFLSQESSPDAVQEALSLGALGYVKKAFAGTELLIAVESVLQGKQFVRI